MTGYGTWNTDNDDDIEALEAYDEACEYGVSAVFYTWDDDATE